MAVEVRFGEGHVSAARVRTLNGIRNRWRSAKRCAALPEDRRGRNPSRSEGFVPNGIRTRVLALKGPRPRPLDDGDAQVRSNTKSYHVGFRQAGDDHSVALGPTGHELRIAPWRNDFISPIAGRR